MLKCILWGTGDVFQKNIGWIKLHELSGQIEVVAITSKDITFSQIQGYKVVLKEELPIIDFNVIIVMTDRKNYTAIICEAENMGIGRERIIHVDVFKRININISHYMELKKNPPSILANNCWGGMTYHSLDLPFMSPLINMSVHEELDYLKLCNNPKHYMNMPIEPFATKYNAELGREYPIAKCDDINLHFIHYETLEEATDYWNKRKARIDWDNLFVMMYTESKETATKFLQLPYEKKICFVPFMTNEPSLCYVNCYDAGQEKQVELWRKVNHMAGRKIVYYDDVELLYEGKIKRISIYK